MDLEADAAAFLAELAARVGPITDDEDWAARRRQLEAASSSQFTRISPPVSPDLVRTTELRVATPRGDVGVRVFAPTEPGARRPALIYFWGGAFWMRNHDTPDVVRACADHAIDADALVIEVDYPLAPEAPYPAAVEAGYAVLCWVHDHAEELGVDRAALSVGGASAGACIATAVALYAKDHDGPPIALQVLEVPATDLTLGTLRARARAEQQDEISAIAAYFRLYLPDESRARESYASPLLASTLSGLPPTLVLLAEHDLLRWEGEAYADALRRDGVPVAAVMFLGSDHMTPSLSGVSETSRRWRDLISARLRSLRVQGQG